MTATQAPAPQLQPVYGYGLQSQTVEYFQPDKVQDKVVDLSQANSTPVNFDSFQNTDVVRQWFLAPALSVTAPTGTTNVVSKWGPYAAFGEIKVNVQNQFFPIDSNGIDAYVKEAIWPYREKSLDSGQVVVANANYPAVNSRLYGADAESISTASLAWNDLLPLGPAYHFDDYYEIDFDNGNTLALGGVASRRLWTGIQFMGGTNRSIFPRVNYNPIVGTNDNNGLYTVSGTQTAAASGTSTVSIYRDAIFQTNPAYLPQPTNWVPVYTTYPVTVGAATTFPWELPKTLQVLGIVLRFYDPATPGPVPLANISELKLSVGSGLVRRQDTPLTMQKRLNAQTRRANLLPEGTLVWDLVHDEAGRTSNRDGINTIVTQGGQVEVKFSTAMSAQGQAFISIFGLQYVQQAGL